MTSALKFPKNGPVPGRDHATHMLQKKKIHEISCLRSRSLDPGRDHVYTFCKKPKFIDILFWAREIPMLKFHNAKWIMQMIEFQWCKTLILMIHALVLAWYVEFFDIAWILQSGHELFWKILSNTKY